MKLVYFGSDVFLSCFEYLTADNEILALYTYHNDEDFFQENNIVRRARSLGIPVHYEPIAAETDTELFEDQGCELFFVAEYDKKIAIPEGLKSFKGINTHSSLLPNGRSYYPIECAMARDLPETGVTMHKVTNDLDCGDIIRQRRVAVTQKIDSVDVYLLNAANALDMLKEILADFETAWEGAKPQGEILPYWKRPQDELLTVTHDMTVQEALEVFRRYNSMTEVVLEGQVHFVYAMMPGEVRFPGSEMRIRDEFWLLGLRNGHIRVYVSVKDQKNRI